MKEIVCESNQIMHSVAPTLNPQPPYTPSDEDIKGFKIRRRGRQRERQKKNGFVSKTTTLHVHHAFLYIPLPVFARLQREKYIISRFMEDINKQGRNFISLFELGYGP